MSIEVPGDNILCDWCNRRGVPYEYKGQQFSGLIPNRGSRLCRPCCDDNYEREGINILVTDGRPGIPDYVYNTVRDRDLVQIWIPPERRGIDGRDIPRFGKRKR